MGNRLTKGLSVRAPWWWFILHGGKDVENRTRPTSFRGTVCLHASAWWRTWEALETMHDFGKLAERAGAPMVTMPVVRPYGGCIVGTVDIIDCVSESASPWFFGPYGYVLSNPVSFAEPIPCKGMLGFFTVPPDVQVRAAGAEIGMAPEVRS